MIPEDQPRHRLLWAAAAPLCCALVLLSSPALGQDAHVEDAHVEDAHAEDAHVEDAHVEDAHAENGQGGGEAPDTEAEDVDVEAAADDHDSAVAPVEETRAPALALPHPRAVALERALERSLHLFDPVVFLSASRELLTAVYEGVCAAHYLIPPEDGVDWGLGIGCLLGALTLSVMSLRQFRAPRSERDARERLIAFRQGGPIDAAQLAHFEDLLAEGARRGRRRRLVGGVYGILNFVATVVLGVLVGRDVLPRSGGVAIASGTFTIGVLGIANFWVESADESALRRYRAGE